MAVAEPPFARGRIEGEAGRFHEFDGAGVERVLGRWQREGEEIFGAIDKQGLGADGFLMFVFCSAIGRRDLAEEGKAAGGGECRGGRRGARRRLGRCGRR